VGQDLAHAIRDSAPKLMITDAENAEKLIENQRAQHTGFPLFVTGGAPKSGFRAFAELQADGPVPPTEIGPGDPVVVIYTGGTTGMPKGVLLPHFAVICGGLRTIETFDMEPEDNYFSISQLFHVGGLFGAVMGPMIAGARATIERRFSLSNYWRRIRESGATLIDLLGTTMALLCREPPSPEDRAHKVRASLGITTGVPDQIPRDFAARFGIKLINLYSLSEGGGTMIVRNAPDSPKPEAHGKGWGWVEIAILDKIGQRLPPHTMGEIALRPNYPFIFMLGYLNNPQKTIETFRNCWLHTGDLGYLDEEGYLYFRGRHAHWLRRRGENISAHEVEAILSQHPAVGEVVVVGIPSDMGDEEVKAFIIAKPGATLDLVALCRWGAEQMAAFKVPRFIEIVDDFPRSLTKREIERHKLRAMPNGKAWDREAVMGRKLERGGAVSSA
jgi:crotonobetaine/carnitine-CoA ligase